MNLNEAKSILKRNGYTVLKEEFDYDAFLINSYERSIGGDGPDSDEMHEYAREHCDLPTQKDLVEQLPDLQTKIPGLIRIEYEQDFKEPEFDDDKVLLTDSVTLFVQYDSVADAENDDLRIDNEEKYFNILLKEIEGIDEAYESGISDQYDEGNVCYFTYTVKQKAPGYYTYDPY